jgi:hypothetical protein
MSYQIASEAQLRFEELTTSRNRIPEMGTAGRITRSGRPALRRNRRKAA